MSSEISSFKWIYWQCTDLQEIFLFTSANYLEIPLCLRWPSYNVVSQFLDFLNSRSSIFTPFHLPTHTTRYYTSSLPELIPILNHTIFTSLSGHNLLFVPYLSHSPVCTKSVPSAHPHNVPCGNSIPSSKFVFISIYLIMSFMHVYL